LKTIALALLLSATGQKVGGEPPTSDVSHKRVTATGSTTARSLATRAADVVNVKDFGAPVDGVTDALAAFNLAAAKARDTGKCLLVPGLKAGADELKDMYVISGPLDLTGIHCIDFQARIKYTSATGTALTFGTNSFTGYDIKSHFDIRGVAVLGTGAGSTATGIEVRNISQSKIEIRSIVGFQTGLKVWADSSDYVAHTTFHIQDIRQAVYGLVLDGGPTGGQFNEAGWINENLFIGGNISESDGVTGLVGIWVKGTYAHNNNTWVKPCLQGWAMAVQFDVGTGNQVLSARGEASAALARFNGTADYNYVEFLGEDLRSGASHVDNAAGGSNVVVNNRDLYLVPLIPRDFRDAWDDGTDIHVPGFNVRTTENGDSYKATKTTYLVKNADGSISTEWNTRIGVTVHASSVKHFIVTTDRAAGAAAPLINVTCYDADGAVLSGSAPYYVATQLGIPGMFDASGAVYERATNGKIDDTRHLVFRSEVKSARIEIAGAVSIFGLQVFAVGSLERSQSGYSLDYVTKALFPPETFDSPQNDFLPTTFSGWRIGQFIRNVSSATLPHTAGWLLSAKPVTTLTAPVASDNHVFVTSTAGMNPGDVLQIVSAGGSVILTSSVDTVSSGTDFWSFHAFTASAGDTAQTIHWNTVPSLMRTLMYDAAAPTSGTWKQGDAVLNVAPAVGQPKGWRCTASGTPGTWVSEGNL
jgi:hypothetical protein